MGFHTGGRGPYTWEKLPHFPIFSILKAAPLLGHLSLFVPTHIVPVAHTDAVFRKFRLNLSDFSEPCFENGLSGRLRPLSIFPMFRQEVYQAMCHKSNLGTLLDQLFLFQTFTVVDEIWQFSTSDGWRDMWTNILIKHRNHILLHKHWCHTFIIWHSFIIPCYQQEASTHIKAKLPSFKILDT